MYPVSEAFLQAVQENTRSYYWSGKITTTAGKIYEFGPEKIVKGSGYISSQCCGSTEIELGTVYSAELGITLLSDIDRYTLEDALVEMTYHLKLPDGAYETVPMGIFEVSEANRTVKCLELKAYDYMLRFEKDFNGFETVGKAYDFVNLCCYACKVEMAEGQDSEWYAALPNGSETLSIYTDNDIETYRDVLYYVGQVLGGFYCINRYGKLELRKYGSDPVMTVQQKHRFSSSFSDFITRYTAVSSTNKKTETAEYYHLEVDDGLTMNLGVNPLLQFGLDETREQLCMNILYDLGAINYVPFDSDTIGNPALNLGDVLKFTGGQADEDQISAITSMQCNIGGKQTLKGVGKNPWLSRAKSKNDKNISGLLSQIDENKAAGKISIHSFTNASAYSVAADRVKIISIDFATTDEGCVQFFGQIIVDVTADPVEKSATAKGNITVSAQSIVEAVGSAAEGTEPGEDVTVSAELPVSWAEDGQAVIKFTFEFNDEEITVHYPTETWCSGKHTILLYYPIAEVVADYTNTFKVYMQCTGGSAVVDVGNCVASITGQSMGAGDAWDGKLEISDSTAKFGFGTGKEGGMLKVKSFAEAASWEIDEVMQKSYSDVITGKFSVGAFCTPVDIEE